MQNKANKPRVLVVEDDPNVRTLLTRHLRKTGYDVAEAGDAETVLSGEKPTGYDLVLTDVHLPGQSGVELARQLRSESEAPVVFLTGDADEKLARAALSEGAAGYLLKPFEVFELDALVRTALRPFRKRAAAENRSSREITTAQAQERALASWRAAIQRPEQIVLRTGRTGRRPLPFGVKAAAAVVLAVVISWFVGSVALHEGHKPRRVSADVAPVSYNERPALLTPFRARTD